MFTDAFYRPGAQQNSSHPLTLHGIPTPFPDEDLRAQRGPASDQSRTTRKPIRTHRPVSGTLLPTLLQRAEM